MRLAAVVLAGRCERSERAPLDLERGAGHADDHRERVACLALAVRAVADGLDRRLGVSAVRHTATQTATGDRFGGTTHAGVTVQETACRRVSLKQPATGEQFGEQIESNRARLRPTKTNESKPHQPSSTQIPRAGAGRSQVQILSPRLRKGLQIGDLQAAARTGLPKLWN